MRLIERVSKNWLVKFLSSIKITVVCLFLLFVLTFWGTVAQVTDGLYAAQAKYFASFFFLAFGFFPFPGAQLVLWVLFCNLSCVTLTRFIHYLKPRYIGILVIHFGLLLYLVSAFVIFHGSVESNVHLAEKEGTNVSSSYQDWELAVWKDKGLQREVSAYDATGLRSGNKVELLNGTFKVLVQQFYLNAHAFTSNRQDLKTKDVQNSSGISLLEPIELLKEREKNIAGGVFEINASGLKPVKILLYGSDPKPTSVKIGQDTYQFSLRHKKYPLPFTIELLDFRVKFHPGTQIAESYESTVVIKHDGTSREIVVSMNKPLRYKNFTFYQASYAIDSAGNEYSTFAVVKNSGRLLPYISSLLTFGGLALHFLMMAFSFRKAKKK